MVNSSSLAPRWESHLHSNLAFQFPDVHDILIINSVANSGGHGSDDHNLGDTVGYDSSSRCVEQQLTNGGPAVVKNFPIQCTPNPGIGNGDLNDDRQHLPARCPSTEDPVNTIRSKFNNPHGSLGTVKCVRCRTLRKKVL